MILSSVQRHHDLWFDDGSCVLVSDPPVLFRVHRALLARHSLVFRDMFSLARPSCEEIIEGCPVVHLQDSPEDLTRFLIAVYDGASFEDFQDVASVLRMATKYAVDSLRNKAIKHLMLAWPTTFEGWQAREETAHKKEASFPHPSLIIDLAQKYDVPSLLPSAFYDLSRYSFSQVFEESHSPSCPLSLPDAQKLALGKESSYGAVSSMIRSMGPLRRPSPACRTPAICGHDFGELYEAAAQHYLFDPERASDPLSVAEELSRLKFSEFSECLPCSSLLEKNVGEERDRLWRRIPVWFRLPPWDSI